MKKLINIIILAMFFIVSCEKESVKEEEIPAPINAGGYPLKEFYFERNPSVNVWGTGMDFIHAESKSIESALDYEYLLENSLFPYDIKFYTVKAYYSDNLGNTLSEGCPAMLLGKDVTACKIGEGVSFFDSLNIITTSMIANLVSEPAVDYEACKVNGNYDRTLLFAKIDECIIGRNFRSSVLVIPEGKTEQEVQPVYLVKTIEGGFVKFMIKLYKGEVPKEKQTQVRWQVLSE